MSGKIGFDLTFIDDLNRISGEGIIALNILKGICESELIGHFIIFTDDKIEKQLRVQYKNLRIVVTKKKGKKFYNKFIKKYMKKNPLSIMFYPHANYQMKGKIECKQVVVLHGINSKEISKRKIRKTIKFLKTCNQIIAVSEFVKKELHKQVRSIKKKDIIVIENPLTDIRPGVEIVYKKKYILCIGNDDSSKNLLSIVKAFNEIAGEIDHDLIVVGKIHENGKTYKYIRKYGLSHRVIVTGHMGRDTLFGYYRNASLFINASTYEGFGLTPLEAMAVSIKVITTMTPSLKAIKDIVCEGYIKNPYKYHDIAETIMMVIQSPKNVQALDKRAKKVLEYYGLEKVTSDINKTIQTKSY